MGKASDKVLTFEFPPTTDAVPAARAALNPLGDEVDADAMDDARLLVSELVTNAVRHAGLGPRDVIKVSARVHDGILRVVVRDAGVGFDVAPRTIASSESAGWGLHLVAEIAERWGATVDGATEVWFEIAARRASS